MKKPAIIAMMVFFAFLASAISVFAQPINTTNYSISSSAQGIQISQLRYTPYPANPGEYVDVWIEAQIYGSSSPTNATFILEPKFPFSLDPNESAIQSFGRVGFNTIVLHYKVRIDSNAVPGDNELDLAYSSDGTGNVMLVTPLEIDVQNSQTDFSIVVQDSSSSGTSLGIANTGENTANSLIMKVPEQPNFRTTGVTNSQILGNLNSGDYTLATFQLEQTNPRNNTLEIELDYTDAIGVRRTVVKDVALGQSSAGTGVYNSTRLTTGAVSSGQFAGQGSAYFQRNFQRESIFSNAWFWTVIGIVALIGGFAGFNVYIKKQRKNKTSGNSKPKKEKQSSEPDWVAAERAKKGK